LQKLGLGESTVAAGMGTEGSITLSVFHKTAQGTEDAVSALRGNGWNVLDAPKGRSPDFHAERQLDAAGFTEIGISRQRGMCSACDQYFANRSGVNVTPYRGRQ
jgi:hypothetical protein